MTSSPEDQLATMIANISEKTGKPLPEWIAIIEKSGLEKHGAILKLLKEEHGVTHGFANLIAAKARETGEEVDPVAVQYSGSKEALRPLYEDIVKFARTLGSDVEIAPKKTSVSLRRKKQFALITPATKTRIDMGVALKGEEPTERLETYNAMCSHKVRLETVADFDDEAKDWIKEAYSRSG
ncbi:DUF4287 domain-containing protein [Allopontixanthobacter sediminis]|uniref:DUF4287 domain-containing protein n=1 Tax=Allopontixanthobacter sediminis TaxID=1689985 RepID=A0A845B3X3_9SPHN|nr:DUF4287 domain-containing protein [Allopontixanthobacter sediminis]MXP45355.1 DUF4287 domain-containing protein [Allopontixanthobacter sediminis]